MTRIVRPVRTGLAYVAGAIVTWAAVTAILHFVFEVRIEASVHVLIGFVLAVVVVATAIVLCVRADKPGSSVQFAETMESLYSDAAMQRLNDEEDRRR